MPIIAASMLLVAGVFAALTLFPFSAFDVVYDKDGLKPVTGIEKDISVTTSGENFNDTRSVVNHLPLPEAVKSIYMSACVVGTPNFRDKLVALANETEINSIVIDIKDFSGTLSFPPENDAWKQAWENADCGARDMREFIQQLHDQNIFVIGRITVFQDPFYTKNHPELAVKRADRTTIWTDYKGLSFIDVGAKPYWDDLIKLVVDSYNIGFDELNFDYVRYPSDGPMNDISFTHAEATQYGKDKQANLEAFFKYLNERLDDESIYDAYKHENTGRDKNTPWTSADLFGMTTTNFDDLSIGQVQDRAAPYFDFIAPMVYPSHYPKSFLNLGNPNDYPYKVVYHAMKTGVDRMKSDTTPMQGFLHERIGTSTPATYKKPTYDGNKLRTWIQDFDYGGDYDAADVRAQIQASNDAGVKSFMIWAPSNIYTRAALKPEGQ
jgi:hypothetical protein